MTDTRKEATSEISRRAALRAGAGAVGLCGLGWAFSPFIDFSEHISLEELLQRHYRELTAEERERIFQRLEKEAADKYGVAVDIKDPTPNPAVKYAYALNLSLCIGCRQCSEACHRENNHDRRTHNSYIKVFELERGNVELSRGSATYDHPVPKEGSSYMPVQCHHCDKAPCVNVCPVKATWKEPDGLVVIDYNWCIGCRYCEVACPYHGRRFNWQAPKLEPSDINPDQGYLSNRVRMQGVMEKCTFCLHRTREGRLPACLEACPAGARVFGNVLDPHSEIRWVLENKRLFILKQEWGTVPSFYYFFSV